MTITVSTSAAIPVQITTPAMKPVQVTVPIGKPGPPGADGAPGPKGDPGSGVTIKGTYSGTSTPLPTAPAIGDMWIIGTPVPTAAPPRPGPSPAQSGDGMVWEGTQWNNVGPIRGPVGPQGPQGTTGATGPPGATGSQGPQGVTGATGSQGIQGPQGLQGVPGTPGEQWFTQAGAPAGATGIVGDWSVNSTNGDFYEKTGTSVWTQRGSLRGVQGPQGLQGVQGPEGPEGDLGPVGPPGLYMSPDPPPTTALLWADTDEEGTGGGTGGTGGVTDVYLIDANLGKTLAPGAYQGVKWNDQTVTSQPLAALPPGWLYEDTGTTLRFPAGVYAISLTSYAEDRDFSCGLQIRYPYGITTSDNSIYLDTPQASPHSYYKLASVSQTFPLTPWYDEEWDEYYGPYLWFFLSRPAAAIGTKKINWQFSMVRLGDIPGYTGPPMGSVDTLMARSAGGGSKPPRVPPGVEVVT